MRKIALISALLLLIGASAFAETFPDYAAVKLGAYFPRHSDMDGSDTGFNAEVAFGHYFTPNVALEFSVGYLNTSGSDGGRSWDITSYPVLLSIKAVAPVAGGELYAIGGGGFYITNADVSGSGRTVSSDDTPFGFQLGAGGNFNISPNVYLGLEGKYFWAKPTFDVPGSTEDVHIDGIQATANIGYRF